MHTYKECRTSLSSLSATGHIHWIWIVTTNLMRQFRQESRVALDMHEQHDAYTGWPKKSPELCVTIMARILYGAKFPLAHL